MLYTGSLTIEDATPPAPPRDFDVYQRCAVHWLSNGARGRIAELPDYGRPALNFDKCCGTFTSFACSQNIRAERVEVDVQPYNGQL